MEARAEMVQAKRGGWNGVTGAQVMTRDFSVVGEEKFVPANHTVQTGIFTLQSLDLGSVRLEAGGRYEHSQINADADEALGLDQAIARSFNAYSFSACASYAIAPNWRIGVNGARSERAPSAEELFARGPHAGTQAFELGNP
ncbi:MAG TPA: TonB-dependent receptor, partial [Rhodanobacter sp.]